MPSRNPSRAPSPPPESHSQTFLSYPVKHVVNSALRRLSSDPFSRRDHSNANGPGPREPKVDDTSRESSQPPSTQPSSANLSALWHNLASSNIASSFNSFAAPHPPQNSHTPPSGSRTPPFQPPPLTPLTLQGYRPSTPTSARLLSPLLAEEIRLLVPPRLQITANWSLLFSLEQDGASLATLYQRCEDIGGLVGTSASGVARGGCVLVVRDGTGCVFGAYLTDPPHPSKGHYYGHGECFLWRAATLSSLPTLASLPPPPSEDTTHATRITTVGSPNGSRKHAPATAVHPPAEDRSRHPQQSLLDDNESMSDYRAGNESASGNAANETSANNHLGVTGSASGATTPSRSGTQTPERIRFKAFPYSGENDYLIFCEHRFLSVGGGDGHYGLWLDDSLEGGVSQPCPTFGNEPLSGGNETTTGKFDVLGVELWWVGS